MDFGDYDVLTFSVSSLEKLSDRDYDWIISSSIGSQTFGFCFDGFDCLFVLGPLRLRQIQCHKCRGGTETWNTWKPLLMIPCFTITDANCLVWDPVCLVWVWLPSAGSCWWSDRIDSQQEL
jgi:hypothetical protein